MSNFFRIFALVKSKTLTLTYQHIKVSWLVA